MMRAGEMQTLFPESCLADANCPVNKNCLTFVGQCFDAIHQHDTCRNGCADPRLICYCGYCVLPESRDNFPVIRDIKDAEERKTKALSPAGLVCHKDSHCPSEDWMCVNNKCTKRGSIGDECARNDGCLDGLECHAGVCVHACYDDKLRSPMNMCDQMHGTVGYHCVGSKDVSGHLKSLSEPMYLRGACVFKAPVDDDMPNGRCLINSHCTNSRFPICFNSECKGPTVAGHGCRSYKIPGDEDFCSNVVSGGKNSCHLGRCRPLSAIQSMSPALPHLNYPSCSSDGECKGSEFCHLTERICKPQAAIGQPCTDNGKSRECRDSVCYERICRRKIFNPLHPHNFALPDRLKNCADFYGLPDYVTVFLPNEDQKFAACVRQPIGVPETMIDWVDAATFQQPPSLEAKNAEISKYFRSIEGNLLSPLPHQPDQPDQPDLPDQRGQQPLPDTQNNGPTNGPSGSSPNKPDFLMIGLVAGGALLVVIIIIILCVIKRKEKSKTKEINRQILQVTNMPLKPSPSAPGYHDMDEKVPYELPPSYPGLPSQQR